MGKSGRSPLAGRVGSNFGGSVNKRTKKIIAGLLIATLGPLVATTLAASVTIGTGNLEFGQGSQQAVACSPTLTTAITETWYQAGPYFQVATIVITGLNTTACTGKNFKISLLGSTGTALTVGASSATAISVALTDVSGLQSGGTLAGATATLLTTTSTSNTLTVTINPATPLNASSVYRVAVETS